MTPADQRAAAPSSQQLSPAARWEGARDEDSSLERARIEKVQGECVEDHVRAVLLEAVERVACKEGDGPGDLAESQASPSPAAADLPARASPLASDSETTAKADRPPQAQSEATVKPARRGSRRGSATLAQREAAAREALAAALNRTGMDRKAQSKGTVYGTVFGTCQVGQVACTAIQVTTRNRLALVEQCSDAVLGDLARRNSGWSAELGLGSQQIFLLAEGEAKSTAVFSRHGDSQALVIHLFGTAAPCQQQGYGTALLRMLQKFADGADIFVEVATDKLPAWWLSKAFLGSFTKFSKPRLWPKTTALLRWNADTDAICSVCQRGQTVHLCPFRSCSYESRRASDLQHHIQSKHAEQSPRHSGHQLWQEPASFKGELGAPSSREQGAERISPALGKTLHHQRPTQVLAAEESSVKRPRATTRKLSGDDVRKRSDRQGKHDNQEQKWVRKIVALARQTDKSDLPAKAKALFRMMKADLRSSTRSESEEDSDGDSSESNDNHICADCGREFSSSNGLGQHRRHCTAHSSGSGTDNESSDSSESEDKHICTDCGREFSSLNGLGQHRRYCDAHSSESGTDDESSDSSISGESDSSDDENRFENAVIRVGEEYQCSDIQSVSAVTVPSNSDCATDSRAGTVVWSPTRISASELERYLTMLRDLETRSAADEYMIDPWPREEFGQKPWVQERDRDPCASLRRGEIPSDHPSVKPESGYPLRMDTGLHHLAECNYDIEQAGLGLQDLFQKENAEVDYAMLIIEAIKTHGKDFAKVCSAVNEVVATDAVRLGRRPDPVTVAHVTEFYYSKWRHTNACEEWRRSAQYRQSKQEVHGQENSRQDNHASTSRLLSSKRRKSDNTVHAGSNGESDGESDGESESEREREQERRRSRASVAAAQKLELEAQQALRQSLRQPPDICTTGTVDPRVNGELPAAWTCNRAEISRRPSAQELGTWVPEALEAYWAARWRAWDREKLRVLQRACGRLSLAATGDKFDLVLRLTRFDMGGGGPALLLLDDLTGPLHQTVADELWARGQMPSITAGDVNMIGDAGGLLEAAKQLPLPTAAVLRSWTLESQREFWLWRWREWVKRSMAECQAACAACAPALWAVAKPARRSIRARLCLHEFAPEFLGARDLAGFYELESQYLEVQFDDDSWWFGQVVKQQGARLLLQWIDGQSEWVDDIQRQDEYRVVESPKTETIIELVLAQLITNVEQIEERRQTERTHVETPGQAQKQSASQIISAPSTLAELISKSGTVNTRLQVAIALASNGKVECTDADGRNRAGRTYVALDNETPAAIAIKLGLDAKELVALNKELYPTLSQNAKLKADTVLRLGDLDLRSNADADLQTVTKTFWTHRAGPLLEELVDCIEELQKQHEVLVFNQKYSGRASIRSRVRDHLESYERTHPGLYVCTELSYGTRRRLSAKALQQGREMGFSSTFFRTFKGFRTHAQLVAAVRKLLEGGGVTRKELFDGCEQDGVQPFRSQSHFTNWLNGPLASDNLDELENAVDQMLWNRIDKTRREKLLIMKTGNKQDLEGKKSTNEGAADSLSTSCIESYKKYHQKLLCKYSCDHGCGYTGVFGDVEAHEAVCTFQTADQTRRRVSLVPQKPADAGDSMLMDETRRENFESADEIYKKTMLLDCDGMYRGCRPHDAWQDFEDYKKTMLLDCDGMYRGCRAHDTWQDFELKKLIKLVQEKHGRRDSALQHRADWRAVTAELQSYRTITAVSAMYGHMTDKRPGCPWEMHMDEHVDPAEPYWWNVYTGEAQWTDPRTGTTSSSHLPGHGKTACKAHNYCCRNPWSVNKIAYRRSLLMDQLELYRGVNEGRGCRKRKAVERDDTDLYSKRAKPCHTEIALEQQRRDDAKAAADEYKESLLLDCPGLYRGCRPVKIWRPAELQRLVELVGKWHDSALDWDRVATQLYTHRAAAAVSAKYAEINAGSPWEMRIDDTSGQPRRYWWNKRTHQSRWTDPHTTMLTQMMTQRASKRAHKYCRSKKTAARTSKANTRYMRSLLIDQPELYRGSGAKRRTYYRKRKAAESANNEEESYRKSLLQDEAGRYRGCKPVATQRSYKKRAKRMVPDKQEESYRKSLLQDEAGRYRGCEPVARKRSYKKRAKRMGPAGMKTPYNCFYAAESPRLKAENPGISQQELARLTGAAWGQLTVAARARYNVLAERDKERYSQELAVYNRMLDLPSAQAPVVPIDGPAPKQQKLSHGQAATDAQLLLCDHGCGYTGAFGDVEAHEAVCTFQSADPEPEPHEKATNGAQRPSGDANTPAAEALNTGIGIRIADLVRGAVVAVRPDENDKGPQPFWLARIDKAATRQRTTIDVTWLESTDGKTYQLDLSDPIPQASVICVVRSSLLRARLMLTTNEAESVIAKLNAQKEAGAATTDEDP